GFSGRCPSLEEDSQRRLASRSSRRAADQIYPEHQPQDGQGARDRSAAGAARSRRRGDRVKRREFITLVGALAAGWPCTAGAQQPRRARVGWFSVAPHPYIDGFRRGMRELGWVEGENLLIEYRYADGRPERLPALAEELARGANDIMVISGSDALAAARASIRAIPIVGIASNMGIGVSLARSEANLTGIALLFDELATKWPELLAEAIPHARRIGMVF